MQKDDMVYIGHMRDMARQALRMVQGKNRPDYDLDETLRLALVHLIQTIGEAARRVSQDFRDAQPEIPWRQIVRMRHRVVDDYLNVDYDIVWDVVTLELPRLVTDLARFVPEEPPE